MLEPGLEPGTLVIPVLFPSPALEPLLVSAMSALTRKGEETPGLTPLLWAWPPEDRWVGEAALNGGDLRPLWTDFLRCRNNPSNHLAFPSLICLAQNKDLNGIFGLQHFLIVLACSHCHRAVLSTHCMTSWRKIETKISHQIWFFSLCNESCLCFQKIPNITKLCGTVAFN